MLPASQCKPKAIFPRKVPPTNDQLGFHLEFICRPDYDLKIFGRPVSKEWAAEIVVLLDAIAIFIFYVMLIYAELFISLTDRDNDVKLLSASDFTVKLSHCNLK